MKEQSRQYLDQKDRLEVKSVVTQSSKCKDCATGVKQQANYDKYKAKGKSLKQFIDTAREYGAICTPCIHNGIKGMKAKLFKKAYPDFQSIDCFIPKEVMNDDKN